MIKIFYSIQVNYNQYDCVYELKDYTLGKDNKTLYFRDQIAFTTTSILPELISNKYHITINSDRIIDGKKVESIYNVSFVK